MILAGNIPSMPLFTPTVRGATRRSGVLILGLLALPLIHAKAPAAGPWPGYDIMVAADGSGDFTSIQKALQSIPAGKHERTIVFIKNGVYRERIQIGAACVTLRGESREGTRIEFGPAGDPNNRSERSVPNIVTMNVNGDDCVLQDLTVRNTQGVIGPHEVAIFGRADRTVIEDCDVLSMGADTLSLWANNGHYYHARLRITGSVDFVCPHGWCYMTDCSLYQENTKADASIWNDGSLNRDMKLVLRDCQLDGASEGWMLGRHHHDGQFYLIDCTFSQAMKDKPIYRVIYPLAGSKPAPSDASENKRLDATNRWGERAYYFNSHREGGDYAWIKDNLATAPGHPTPEQVTARWTFGGAWDPERTEGPAIVRVEPGAGQIAVVFGETVTVKGHPVLELADGGDAGYASGSGTTTLVFKLPAGSSGPARVLDLNGGAILASEASAALRGVSLAVPLP